MLDNLEQVTHEWTSYSKQNRYKHQVDTFVRFLVFLLVYNHKDVDEGNKGQAL